MKTKGVLHAKESQSPGLSPGIVKPPKNERKRARMMVDKSPDVITPRKRKPTTRARSIKDMLMKEVTIDKENHDAKQKKTEQTKVEFKIPDSKPTNDSSGNKVTSASMKTVKSDGKEPTARWGHTLTMIAEDEAVLIGGQGDKQQFSRDSCWLLDLARHQWRTPETTAEGQKPEARMGHTAVYDPTVSCIYVFGGSKQKRWFNDVHILDVDNWKWQAVKANGKAPTRSYHSCILYRHELWIFGGVYPQPDPQPDASSNDIHVFTPMEESWYMPIFMGEKPAPRSGHSATLLEDQMVMFGGWDYPTVFNDLHILDLTFVEWSQPEVNGAPPSPRSWHADCALSGKRVLIHGGYDGNVALNDSFIFNLSTKTWTEVVLDLPISIRAGHTSLCLPYKHTNNEHDEVLIFGGGDNEEAFYRDLFDILIPVKAPDATNALTDVNS